MNSITIENGFVSVRWDASGGRVQPLIRNECSLQAVLGVKPKVRQALTTVKCLSCAEDSEKQSARSSEVAVMATRQTDGEPVASRARHSTRNHNTSSDLTWARHALFTLRVVVQTFIWAHGTKSGPHFPVPDLMPHETLCCACLCRGQRLKEEMKESLISSGLTWHVDICLLSLVGQTMEAKKTLSLIFPSLFSGPSTPMDFIEIALHPNKCLAEYLGGRLKEDFCKLRTLLIKYWCVCL